MRPEKWRKLVLRAKVYSEFLKNGKVELLQNKVLYDMQVKVRRAIVSDS